MLWSKPQKSMVRISEIYGQNLRNLWSKPQKSMVKTSEIYGWRDSLSNTRHKLEFCIEIPDSTISNKRNPDKVALREKIFRRRDEGRSFCEIAKEVGLSWRRVQQIVKGR